MISSKGRLKGLRINYTSTLVASVMLFCTTSPVSAKKIDFSGVWSMKHCDPDEPNRECGVFYLSLIQEGDRICDEHFVATQGLFRLDEGDPGTVLGVVWGKSLMLFIRSTRNDASYMAEGTITGRNLTWHRNGMTTAGKDNEPPIIPFEVVLSKKLAPEQLVHLKEIEAAPCHWPDQK